VTDALTSEKVTEAEIRISGLVLKSALEGNYLSMIHPGIFDMTASASGYEPVTLKAVEIPTGETVTKDIALAQTCPVVEAPALTPLPGTYGTAQEVSAACSTPDAVIHYTMDGREPTEESPSYAGPVSLFRTTTLRARAFRAGWSPSDTSGGEYVFPGTMGDLNLNGPADLGDLILALRVSAVVLEAEAEYAKADVNDDGVIGLQEAVYIMQKVSGLR
jgi:hypothetical protein